MKKIMMLLVVAVLMLGVSGQAMAYFTDGDLIRVVYSTINGTGYEYATDLGSFSSLGISSTGGAYTGPTQNLNTSNFGILTGQTNFSNMYVTYFIADAALNSNNGAAWTSSAMTNGGYKLANGAGSFFNATELPMSLWNSKGTISASNTQADPSGLSWWANAESSGGTLFYYQGFLDNTKGPAEANLTALNTTGGTVDQLLYYYGSNLNASGRGTVVAEIITNADGSTTIEGAPTTPIPAAVYLFGSGLLGMFGLRRKMAA